MATRKKYSKEFKLDAISLVNEQGYSKADAARNLAVSPGLLGRVDLSSIIFKQHGKAL